MANFEEFIQWFLLMLPLCITPGPCNILCAINGARVGFFKSLPFLCGAYVFPIIYSIAIGFGASYILMEHPDVFRALKFLGCIYILYLSYKFLIMEKVSSSQDRSRKGLTFSDGLVTQMLNIKIITSFVLMYSQFLDPVKGQSKEILTLAFAEIILGIFCNMAWILGGQIILRKFQSEKALKVQRYLFSGMLFGVAIWLVL